MTEKYKRIERGIIHDARNPSKNKLHVVYSGSKGWSVVPDGEARAIRILSSKKNAVNFAKKFLDVGKISVHNTDGTVSSYITVG